MSHTRKPHLCPLYGTNPNPPRVIGFIFPAPTLGLLYCQQCIFICQGDQIWRQPPGIQWDENPTGSTSLVWLQEELFTQLQLITPFCLPLRITLSHWETIRCYTCGFNSYFCIALVGSCQLSTTQWVGSIYRYNQFLTSIAIGNIPSKEHNFYLAGSKSNKHNMGQDELILWSCWLWIKMQWIHPF